MEASRRLRYSERRRLAETGSLGDLVHDEVPRPLIQATLHFFDQACRGASGSHTAGARFNRAVQNAAIAHWGSWIGSGAARVDALTDPDMYLDFAEMVVEEGLERRSIGGGSFIPAWRDAEHELNALFGRHRFGYRLDGAEARRVGSPALDEVVAGPALLAAQRPGWEEIERSYKEALRHQRGPADENDDALTAANAAVEAALKAAGFKGSHLGPLANDFKQSSSAHPQLSGVPELLHNLIQRTGALRNQYSDAHGKEAGAEQVPQELVDLAIYWAGAFIVYLSARAPAMTR